MKTQVIDLDAKPAGEAELDEAVFGLPARSDILARMVQWQLAKRRAGTHKVKQRAEVTGSTMKIWKQKGTGRARHGNKKAPQFRTGGVAHGPVVRDHGFDLPKKVRQLALRTALSVKQATGRLVVLNEAVAADPKTKALAERFEKLGWTNALIIAGHEVDANFAKAARNIPNVDVLPTAGTNVYDILRRDTLVLTRASLDALQARLTAAPEVK